jgi:DNA-binding transcriptional MocR family regulator
MYACNPCGSELMSLWRPRLVESARMKYLGIVEALEADVRHGRVRPGDRLPSQRAIAEALSVDLTTVTRAFNEARRRGLVDAQAGRGSFIREEFEAERLPGRLGSAPLVDLSMNTPPQPAAADLQKAIHKGIGDLLSSPRGMLHLHYQESTGSEPDRVAAAAWLGRRMELVSPSRILVACGAQSALFAVCESQLRSAMRSQLGDDPSRAQSRGGSERSAAVPPAWIRRHHSHAFEEACRTSIRERFTSSRP